LKPRFIAYLAAIALVVSLIGASAASPAIAGSGVTRQIALAGTGSPVTADAPSGDATTGSEFPAIENETSPDAFNGTIDRSLSRGSGSGIVTATAKKAKSAKKAKKASRKRRTPSKSKAKSKTARKTSKKR